VKREDYRPPPWLVPAVELAFDLDPERTRVRARLHVTRSGDHREPLRLDGEGLKLLSVAVDGRAAAHKLDKHGLTIRLAGDRSVIETLAEIVPSTTEQKGLFELGGVLCTQCEAESFRRITFFPDRPDVLSCFRVRLAADKALFPVLLSNGDCIASGDLDDGRHWAEWDDPHPKPCYLFALVAGALMARSGSFTTRTGREVSLGVWTREGDLPLTGHAMAALQAAMRWDEDHYGREYDLSAYNLVALPGFRFGAMENKGLPIYDAALVLADPATATDAELDTLAALVAHEYLHNWSGNRVTCRDWFQLGLKEGFTVFRDQGFSADLGSAAVRRIEDARALRTLQFAEDRGPGAHPVRPNSYSEVAELYTPTVYTKGAEIVRMIHTVLGPKAFRAGADLYFARHDGQAVTCEDFLAAMEQASGSDLSAFRRWYERPGTPSVHAALRYNPDAAQARLTLAQQTPPLPVPLRVALFGADSGTKLAERLVLLEGTEEVVFDRIGARPVLSLNRDFSAPVLVETARSAADLALLAIHDDDPFARHEAMQQLMRETVLTGAAGGAADHCAVIEAVERTLESASPDRGLIAELLALPAENLVAEAMEPVDPARIRAAWKALRTDLGRALEPAWRRVYDASTGECRGMSAAAKGARRLQTVALGYLLASGADDAGAVALHQFEEAETMTGREGALRALADSDAPERTKALALFHQRYRGSPWLLDKWFAAQAASTREDTIDAAPRLLAHPDFTLAHPGRLGAVMAAFTGNLHAFHHPSGRGYRFLADVTLAADRIDPAAAARMARNLAGWRRLEPGRAAQMRAQLERIGAAPGISAVLAEAAGG
jgi:aminopeptidase N